MQTDTTAQTDSILAQLKSRTAHQHQQTEDGVDMMSDAFSLEDYQNLLKKFYAFYKPYDEKMRTALEIYPVEFYGAERYNTPRLVADLKSLGMSDDEIAAVEPFDELPALNSPEKIFGSMYVIEGSTLGGQVISRHLKEKFGFDETGGAAFFSGYGKDTGKMWNAFRQAVTEFADDANVNREEIILSANETFEKIGKCLAKNVVVSAEKTNDLSADV